MNNLDLIGAMALTAGAATLVGTWFLPDFSGMRGPLSARVVLLAIWFALSSPPPR